MRQRFLYGLMVSVSLLTATAVRADDPFDPGHPIEPGSYTLTLLVSDAKMGTVSGAGSYTHGTTVEIEATPNTDYQFIQWSDGVCTNPRNVDILSDLTLTAEFDDEAPLRICIGDNMLSILNNPYSADIVFRNSAKEVILTVEKTCGEQTIYFPAEWAPGNYIAEFDNGNRSVRVTKE